MIFCPMSKEHEEDYTLLCARHVLRYDPVFLWLIICIQVYNILYTLHYTNGTLHSAASRVYTILYVILLSVAAAGLLVCKYMGKRLPDSSGRIMGMQFFFGLFLMIWSACVTIYDQRVSDNISVYLITTFTVAVLVYMTPLQACVVFLGVQIFLCLGLPVFCAEPIDMYGSKVNTTIMSIICLSISARRYVLDRKSYLMQEEMKDKNRKLSHIANHDALTGLLNRRRLNEKMDSLYQHCAEKKLAMTVMMLDIDSFKDYNDIYGHQQGDECLRRMAWCLNQELDPEHEFLFRYGGEEFLYVGAGLSGNAPAEKAERFNTVIRTLIIGPSEQDPRGITVSIGIYTGFPALEQVKDKEWMSYISEADKALYKAKATGKDRWVDFSVQ